MGNPDICCFLRFPFQVGKGRREPNGQPRFLLFVEGSLFREGNPKGNPEICCLLRVPFSGR